MPVWPAANAGRHTRRSGIAVMMILNAAFPQEFFIRPNVRHKKSRTRTRLVSNPTVPLIISLTVWICIDNAMPCAEFAHVSIIICAALRKIFHRRQNLLPTHHASSSLPFSYVVMVPLPEMRIISAMFSKLESTVDFPNTAARSTSCMHGGHS